MGEHSCPRESLNFPRVLAFKKTCAIVINFSIGALFLELFP